jgi:hypothetical protein
MSIKLLEDHLTPAEDEQVVKTYHCTTLDPMLFQIGSKINGYITVTNKRLVYFATGYSGFGAKGNSKKSIELPIADISNMAQGVGTRFDIIRLIVGLITGFVFAAMAAIVVNFLMLMFIAHISPGSVQSRLVVFIDIAIATLLVARSFLTPFDCLTRTMFAAAGFGIIYNFRLSMFFLGVPSLYIWAGQALGALVALYLLWCLYWFIRRNYLTINVSSKSGYSVPIQIRGFSLWSNKNIVAWDTAHMMPANDADKMFRELGALVTDIQTLGDHGIKKWSQNIAEAKTEQETVASNYTDRKPLVLRYAVGFVLLVAVIMTIEFSITTYNQHQAELREAATSVKQQADNARNNANIDEFTRNIVPQLVTKAEQEQSAGETAFNNKDYQQASEQWKLAADQYSQIPNAVKPYRDAEALRSVYDRRLQELISIAFNSAEKSGKPSSDDLAQLSSYLESHAPEEWILVKDAVRKAEAFKTAGQGADYLNEWTQIINVLTPAVTKKVRTEISLKSP